MDKYEYKVRAEEIHNLISEGEFAQAVEIADTIDWRRVKSIKTLCTISDLYKANRRYQESKEILLMAYDRYPGGRLIVYSLCELSIKLKEYVQAIEYYKEYVQLAPKDANRYILQYRLYEAQDVTLEERIEVLEEFKRKDYREKWAYELATLYHKMGEATKCVDECDELIVTFGEGRYVLKAMELKMLHEPLTPSEQAKYDAWTNPVEEEDESKTVNLSAVAQQVALATEGDTSAPKEPEELEIEVKPIDVGQYNTMNLQEALAESMKDIWGKDGVETPSTPDEDAEDNTIFGTTPLAGPMYSRDPETFNVENWDQTGEIPSQIAKTPVQEPASPIESTPIIVQKIPDPIEVAPPITAETVRNYDVDAISEDILSEETKRIPTEAVVDYLEAQKLREQIKQDSAVFTAADEQADKIPGAITGSLTPIDGSEGAFDHMLSQEYDGQISLAIPDSDIIEKQITGQLSIEDIMAEWEQTKKDNEEKRRREVKLRILQHTGSLFDDFDEDTKAGLLDQLEKAFLEAIVKEAKAGNGNSEDLNKRINAEAKKAVEYLNKEKEKKEKEEAIAEETAEPEIEEPVIDKTEEIENADESNDSEAEANIEETSEDEVVEEDDEIEEEVVSDEEEAEVEEVSDEEEAAIENADDEEEAAIENADDEEEAAEEDDEDAEEAEDSESVKVVIEAMEDEDSEEESDEIEEEDTDTEVIEEQTGARELSEEEEAFFASYLTRKSVRRQLINALDCMSMASYSGNVIVTGEEGVGTLDMAKRLVKLMQTTDSNFHGQPAKITGKLFNDKDVEDTLDKLNGGALIIESARGMKKSTFEKLIKALEKENLGILVILEDTADAIGRITAAIPNLTDVFNVRIDLKALDDRALVDYAKEYAKSQEYAIDEFGMLALHTRIEEMQTRDHQVTVSEVRDLVDDAIYYAEKKTPKHLVDVLLRKRYDGEDMVILREKDFMHY